MIYILQELHTDGKWWHVSFHIQKFYAEEQKKWLERTEGTYRIKEFKIPEDVE